MCLCDVYGPVGSERSVWVCYRCIIYERVIIIIIIIIMIIITRFISNEYEYEYKI